MNDPSFDLNEFIPPPADNPPGEDSVPTEAEEAEASAPNAELDVQMAVVESLAADKVEMDHQLSLLKEELARKDAELAALKGELARKEAELAAQQEKEIDLQERNPNALALLDREVELPDRFPGETRDHVLEVIVEARQKAEAEGRVRKAQVLEAVLLANEPNGNLAKKRAQLEKIFADNANIISGPVLEELKKRGISHKHGEEYLLPSEIMLRNY